MNHGSRLRRGAALLSLATILSITPAAAADLYGVDEVTLGWEPASGPVVGYFVIIDPTDRSPYLHGVVAEPRATLATEAGDSFSVLVTAFDKSGVVGPFSLPSDVVRIHRDTSTGSSPPPSGDPPPPDTGDPGPKGPGTAYDFDGDGVSDLLVREPDGGVTVWRMDGAGVVGAEPLGDVPPAWQLDGAGDYDGDGIADLLWEDTASGGLSIWQMRSGSVHAELAVDPGDRAAGDEWHVGGSGDFDGDGTDDIVLFSRILGESEILHMQQGAVGSTDRMQAYRGAFSIDATDDVDGDGVDEIVWRDEGRQQLLLWDLNGSGADAPLPVAEELTGWRVVGSGDFDGDGVADLFAEHAAADLVQVWIQDGTTIAGIVDLPSPGEGRIATHVGDYDRDGRADLVVADPDGGGSEVWFSDGAGVVAQSVSGASTDGLVMLGEEGSDDSAFRERLCDADFDGDGDVDAADYPRLVACFGAEGIGSCEQADMDGDGVVGIPDFHLFRSLFMGEPCGR